MRRILIAAALVPLVVQPAVRGEDAPEPRPGAMHAVPLYGELLRPHDAPDDPYAPGHRGVDVGAPEGTAVRASAAGTVSFAATIFGNRTVTVDHGEGIRTTYSYLGTIAVSHAQQVERGTVLGTVGDGHPGSGWGPHVHLSARRDDVYFDPLQLYVGDRIDDLLSLTG